MTEAEKMLEALGFKLKRAGDYFSTAFCDYEKDFITLNFALFKNNGEWNVNVFSYDPVVDEYAFPQPIDVELAKAIVKRLEELNNGEVE